MKIRTWMSVGLMTATFAAGWAFATQEKTAQDKAASQQPRQPSPNAPNEIHKFLAKLCGEYTTAAKFIVEDKVVEQIKGEAKLEMAMGDRFLVEQNNGETAGRKFEGVRLFGYNNQSELFESTWTYSEATSMMNMTGRVGDDRKTILWDATVAEEKGVTARFKIKTTFIDGDHFSQELVTIPTDGTKPNKMETIYTRKK